MPADLRVQKIFGGLPNALFGGCATPRKSGLRARKASMENVMIAANRLDSFDLSVDCGQTVAVAPQRGGSDLHVLNVHAEVVDDLACSPCNRCSHCQTPLRRDRNLYMAFDLKYCSERCREVAVVGERSLV